MPTIVWTRSHDDIAQDCELWRGSAFTVLGLPCIRTAALAVDTLGLDRFSVAILSSRKAVAYAVSHPEIFQILKQTTVMAFGQLTAQDAQLKGLKVATMGRSGGAEEFAKNLRKRSSRSERILVLGPSIPHFDMAKFLGSEGYDASYLALYHTVAKLELNSEERQNLIANLYGAVCFASPSAVGAFRDALRPQENRLSEALVAVAIGDTTAKAAGRDFRRVVAAPSHSVKDLFNAAAEMLALAP